MVVVQKTLGSRETVTWEKVLVGVGAQAVGHRVMVVCGATFQQPTSPMASNVGWMLHMLVAHGRT